MALNTINRLNRYLEVLDSQKLTKVATDKFRSLTPIRSGNARRNTVEGNNEVEANYPYAGKLDEGYSKQAPNGMSKPTEDWLKQYIRNQLKP